MGVLVEWWYCIVVICVDYFFVVQCILLWLLLLFIGSKFDVICIVSFYIELILVFEVWCVVCKDLVVDMVIEYVQIVGGCILFDEGSVCVFVVQCCCNDFVEGGGYYGINWIGYVMIMLDSKEQLVLDSCELEELCDIDVGIYWFEWFDSYQFVVSGFIWLIGCGIKFDEFIWVVCIMCMFVGKGEKEVIL